MSSLHQPFYRSTYLVIIVVIASYASAVYGFSSWNAASSTKKFVLKKDANKNKKSRRLGFFRKHKKKEQKIPVEESFKYEYNVLPISGSLPETPGKTTGVLLVHPIGVGISNWFYDRLYTSFDESQRDQTLNSSKTDLVLISPDLLGSGSALWESKAKPPMLNISDWSDQIDDLMKHIEDSNQFPIGQWCVVANGGCSPIALQVAARSVEGTASFQHPVSNVILSSVPRLPFFLEGTDPVKVAKSYKTLSGLVGRLFWWYSCKNKGAFIQKFSEKNLVADPRNLGDTWRPTCYKTARRDNGKSRYSTFAFLAGTLQDGCVSSLDTLKKHTDKIRIDVIRGRDIRQNRAKSWFWQRRKRRKKEKATVPTPRFRDYLEENSLGGEEILIGGRISLAHEDAEGYRDAMLSFLED